MRKLSPGEYNKIHKQRLRYCIKSGVCLFCGKICKTQWSNKSGDYLEDDSDWQELCPKCHNAYDRAKFGHLWRKRGKNRKHKNNRLPQRSYELNIDLLIDYENLLLLFDYKTVAPKQTAFARLQTYPWYRG